MDHQDVYIGTDRDGQPIFFRPETRYFYIGPIRTDIVRLGSYARGGQISWSSPEVHAWVEEYLASAKVQEADIRAAKEIETDRLRQTKRYRRLAVVPTDVVVSRAA